MGRLAHHCPQGKKVAQDRPHAEHRRGCQDGGQACPPYLPPTGETRLASLGFVCGQGSADGRPGDRDVDGHDGVDGVARVLAVRFGAAGDGLPGRDTDGGFERGQASARWVEEDGQPASSACADRGSVWPRASCAQPGCLLGLFSAACLTFAEHTPAPGVARGDRLARQGPVDLLERDRDGPTAVLVAGGSWKTSGSWCLPRTPARLRMLLLDQLPRAA